MGETVALLVEDIAQEGQITGRWKAWSPSGCLDHRPHLLSLRSMPIRCLLTIDLHKNALIGPCRAQNSPL
jgi:hypothetical protein